MICNPTSIVCKFLLPNTIFMILCYQTQNLGSIVSGKGSFIILIFKSISNVQDLICLLVHISYFFSELTIHRYSLLTFLLDYFSPCHWFIDFYNTFYTILVYHWFQTLLLVWSLLLVFIYNVLSWEYFLIWWCGHISLIVSILSYKNPVLL